MKLSIVTLLVAVAACFIEEPAQAQLYPTSLTCSGGFPAPMTTNPSACATEDDETDGYWSYTGIEQGLAKCLYPDLGLNISIYGDAYAFAESDTEAYATTTISINYEAPYDTWASAFSEDLDFGDHETAAELMTNCYLDTDISDDQMDEDVWASVEAW